MPTTLAQAVKIYQRSCEQDTGVPVVPAHEVVAEPSPPPSRDTPYASNSPLDTLSLDLWAAIARSARAADGDSVQTWCRLSLVSRTFCDAIAGELTLDT